MTSRVKVTARVLVRLGISSTPLYGGFVAIAGFGCKGCGKGFWIEAAPDRAPVPGSSLTCPFCRQAAMVPDV